MMYKRKEQHGELCVLRVDPDVLELPGVVVTDANASGDYVRFAAAPGGLAIVNRELTFAAYWTDQNLILYFQKKAAQCAEVLVPDRVEPRFITGAYVSCEASVARMRELEVNLPVTVERHLFFL